MACWASVAVSAQLIVNPNGNVAVKSEETPLSALSVNGEGLARSEMNVTGNMLTLWQSLAAVGNDPRLSSSWRIPSLLFEGVDCSGL